MQLQARWGERSSARLTRQYRMHPVICAFPSQAFYGGSGGLVTEGTALDARLMLEDGPPSGWDVVLNPARPLVVLDVPPAGQVGPVNPKSSPRQADAVRALVQALCARGVPQSRIGVIAPHRAHVAAVRQRLAASGLTDVLVDTVDRFQGGEREVIILAIGVDRPMAPGEPGTEFLGEPHRLNVALTRAQRKLVLVANRQVLASVPVLRDLLRHCERLYGGSGGVVRVTAPAG